MPCKKRVERANGDQFEAHHMCFAQRQLFEHFVSDGRIGDVDDERHARFPCSEYHCAILPSRQRSTVSRTSSGRTANSCDCSKPGLMVPMARILVVGVVFIASPCAFAELKPKKQPISANAAAETNVMLSPLCVSLRRPPGRWRSYQVQRSLDAAFQDLLRLGSVGHGPREL